MPTHNPHNYCRIHHQITTKKKRKEITEIEIDLAWCSGLGFVGEGGKDVKQREREREREKWSNVYARMRKQGREKIKRKERGPT